MKKQAIASTMGIVALIASSAWTPVQAFPFSPPPGNGSPSQATGGASRGSIFTNRQNRTVRQATGGASRGSIFQPGANRRVRAAVGGASRGFFQPSRTNRTARVTAGGASRLGRQELDPSLVASSGPAAMLALTPQNYYGTTISERPTILVYLPATDAEEAVFSLKDEAGATIYETTIAVNQEAGIRAISLPESIPALEVGKDYQWFLALKIDNKLNPSAPYVDGWIQRVEMSAEMASSLKQADALQKAKILGQNGHWYDCVATLAMLRASHPTDEVLTNHWSELLSSVELGSITQAPMLVSLN
ncbi:MULTISPECIES: DUF928 domain-containing protein [Leptolyngbya]|jgi:hypothetical protein|uniref:DUF928 domain-containing protein n=2 Tax=Leptolyngbya boryana TaxID=1184 RepID=A0A1Z4JQR5_LEPBY|nr:MULTISPECIES: DUF928 domain-containing protein [Leptolyngbya]BAY59111.1 hypothetical protein NIES2135_59880 [Leptolyngbya boryana NIES-2135]MBD1857094.1 DUF928 domain-containing protein [Leptolyngbya sp. FACHB-1624]MBD2368141.1 DUF928 domain-containing protein [Leptolyngbya sp. FACHB-161]MBD2374822.1 DUF928 domain-containing protein [Leptolyngbya sp. FACHB-238]MBD2399244.1 DUF928 domain-containing protein [Leptolyngbya sp. FACHB-239]